MARRLPFSAKLTTLFVQVLLHEICSAKPDRHCAPSSCGDIRNISYPFRLKDDPKSCGIPRYTLWCESNHTFLYFYGVKYYVRQINYNNHTIRVLDSGFQTDNYSLDTRYLLNQHNFSYVEEYYDPYTTSGPEENGLKGVVFWICEKPVNSPLYSNIPACFDDGGNSSNSSFFHSKRYRYVRVGKMNVSEVQDFCQVEGMFLTSWPENDGPNTSCSDFRDELQYGFELSWSGVSDDYYNRACYFDKGNRYRCGLLFSGYFLAALYSGAYSLILIGMYHGLLMILGAPLIIAFLIYKWRRRHQSMYDTIEEYLQTHNNLMPIRYSYSEIKKMTKNFIEKLGEGGYGTVYKGTLRSQHPIAIKMLSKSKGNGQDFINEVATVGRIHHVNVVQLIGFCVEGSKRALIYEFMPNGSLNKHIFSPEGSTFLSYKRIYDIALGVARGIDYLHRGCDMQILHFDIKPHNILLDENFTAKVSDFGLAKLFPVENNIVSLTAARGTLGYMAPELFYKNIGGISNKSDVYSFGNLLMEMASRRKNVNAFAEHSSQIYFPTWIYDQLHQEENIGMEELDEEEKKIFKKMITVAFLCIQMKPSERPPMNKVIDMLEGDIQSLQMPTKPSLQSLENPIVEAKKDSNHTSSSFEFEKSKLDELLLTAPPIVKADSTC